MSIAQSMLPEFDHEFATLRKTLERVPDGKWDYTPHAKSMNLGRVAGHLAELGGWTNATLEADELDFSKVPYAPFNPTSTVELVAKLDEIVMRALERDMDARWPSAGDMLAALNKYLYSLDVTPSAREVAALVGKFCPFIKSVIVAVKVGLASP